MQKLLAYGSSIANRYWFRPTVLQLKPKLLNYFILVHSLKKSQLKMCIFSKKRLSSKVNRRNDSYGFYL